MTTSSSSPPPLYYRQFSSPMPSSSPPMSPEQDAFPRYDPRIRRLSTTSFDDEPNLDLNEGMKLPNIHSLFGKDLLPSPLATPDEQTGGDGYDFSQTTSYFSTSSERGRWLISPRKLIMSTFRRSEPLISALPTLSRQVSEPAIASTDADFEEEIAPSLPPSSPPRSSSPLLPSSPLARSSSPSIPFSSPAFSSFSPQAHSPTKYATPSPTFSALPVFADEEITTEVTPEDETSAPSSQSVPKSSVTEEATKEAPKSSRKRRSPSPTLELATRKRRRSNSRSLSPNLGPEESHASCSSVSASSPSTNLKPASAKFDDEIIGMVMECMATSRASSMEVSNMYKSLIQTRPALKAEKSKQEWLDLFDEALTRGRDQFGVFDMVESSGRDGGKAWTEAKWFYVPENDPDQERATLLKMMMPRAGKRSTTKKYKQYYWKPLDKISRWDDEDAL